MAQPRDEHGRFQSDGGSPKEWKPRMEVGDADASAVTEPRPVGNAVSPEDVLAEMGLDPAEWTVDSARTARWQRGDGEWLESKRYSFRRLRPATANVPQADVDELLAAIDGWEPRAVAQPGWGAEYAAVINLADWQLGNGEGGGTPAALERIRAMRDRVTHYLIEHRPAQIVVQGLGDLREACNGFYAMQAYSTDLDERQQARTVWRALAECIRAWAPRAPSMRVVAVPGNHGENRQGGKAYTTFGDNSDLMVFEVVQDALEGRPGFEHIEWIVPEDELSVAHDVFGVRIGLTHGHLFRNGSNAGHKAEVWWKGQAFGHGPVSDAQILVTGHFHHLSITEYSEHGRTHMQTPAMDGGSAWFTAATGKSAPAGTLVFLAGESLGPRGWDHLRVL